jgi:glycine/D-amino acid oxidase-like deaminating enzyme
MRGVNIASRWHGMYVKHASEPYVVARPAPGAVAAVGFGGAGMTLSLGAMELVVERS